MAQELRDLNDSAWPEFLLHGDVRNWSSLYDRFAAFQLVFLEDESLIAAGLAVPLEWRVTIPTPETLDEILFGAHWPLAGRDGVLCALAALVSPGQRGRGLSRSIVRELLDLARRRNGLSGVLAPVRPTRKHEFPYEPMEHYAARRDDAGRLVDPWLRVHEELGGRQLGIAEHALTVLGSIEDWQRWTGVSLPCSGEYAVPGALVPVRVDHERGIGEYVEPNVWYLHSLDRDA